MVTTLIFLIILTTFILNVFFDWSIARSVLAAVATWGIVVPLLRATLRAGALSSDPEVRRLGRHDWLTRVERERHSIRRDAAEVLSSSRSARARSFAVACLQRKPNLAVLDTCAREIFAATGDPDETIARACAELALTCIQDGISISDAGQISGVAMITDSANRYLGEVRGALSRAELNPAAHNGLERAERALLSYLRREQRGR